MKKVESSKHTKTEDKLAHAFATLLQKNAAWAEQVRKDKAEAKQEQKQLEQETNKEKAEKAAAEKAENKVAEEKKRDDEAELRVKRRELQAQQSLDLKAIAVNAESDRKKEAALKREIDVEFLKGLRMWTGSQQSGQSRKRKNRESASEADSDKENVEPADE